MNAKNVNMDFMKAAVICMILLDICRHVLIFIMDMGPGRESIIDLNFGAIVGLELMGLYGVFTGKKPLVLIHLAFYIGLAISGIIRAIGARYYTSTFVYISTVYQVILLVVLAVFVRLRFSDEEDASTTDTSEALKLKPKATV